MVQLVIAEFEQKAFLLSSDKEKYNNFIAKLKVVLLAVFASWSVLTRYQKCDHIAACLIITASNLSGLPKKLVLDVFKSFDNFETFRGLKIRHLKKTKFYTGVEDLL